MTRPEAEIRAEIAWRDLIEKDDRTSPAEYPDMALITFAELSAYLAPSPVAGEDEIVEAGMVAANDAINDYDENYVGAMRAAYTAMRPLIARAARASADAEIAAAEARGRIEGLREAQLLLLGRGAGQAYRAIDARIAELTPDSVETK